MKRLLIACLAVFMVVGFSGAALAAPVLSFQFDVDGDLNTLDDNMTIDTVGGTVTTDLYALVVDDDPSSGIAYELQSFGLNLEYDAALLGITHGTVFSDWIFGAPVFDNSTDGSLIMSGAYFNFSPPPYGIGSPMLLGTIVFECEGIGLSPLTIFDSDKGGSIADFALAGEVGGLDLDDQIMNGVQIGSINNPVPIPGAVWLLGSGLLGLVGLRRKIRS